MGEGALGNERAWDTRSVQARYHDGTCLQPTCHFLETRTDGTFGHECAAMCHGRRSADEKVWCGVARVLGIAAITPGYDSNNCRHRLTQVLVIQQINLRMAANERSSPSHFLSVYGKYAQVRVSEKEHGKGFVVTCLPSRKQAFSLPRKHGTRNVFGIHAVFWAKVSHARFK